MSSNFTVDFVKENMKKKKDSEKGGKVLFRESPRACKWSMEFRGFTEVNKGN